MHNHSSSAQVVRAILCAALGLISSSAGAQTSQLDPAVTQIKPGSAHTCALNTSGGVKCWGSNFSGQVGDNSSTDRPTPVDVSGLAIGDSVHVRDLKVENAEILSDEDSTVATVVAPTVMEEKVAEGATSAAEPELAVAKGKKDDDEEEKKDKK